jgi:hypothetical protein
MAARDLPTRTADTLALLEREEDLWIATVDRDGSAYLIPLSFYWDGATITLATPRASRTARNLRRAGRARVALGPTRDVVIVEGPVTQVAPAADPARATAHARKAGFDAREQDEEYVLFVLTPARIQAWRNPAELPGRDVMRDRAWVTRNA